MWLTKEEMCGWLNKWMNETKLRNEKKYDWIPVLFDLNYKMLIYTLMCL